MAMGSGPGILFNFLMSGHQGVLSGVKSVDAAFYDLEYRVVAFNQALDLARRTGRSMQVIFQQIAGPAISAETAFAGVKRTVEAGTIQLQKLEKQLLQLTRTIPITVEEVYGLGEAAGQLGIPLTGIKKFAEVAARLGVATNMSAREAITALAKIQNMTGSTSETVDRLASALVELGVRSAATESEIVDMTMRIAGAAAVVGVGEKRLLAFATAMASLGVRSDAGGSAMSRVMLRMGDAVASGGQRLQLFAKLAKMAQADFKDLFRADPGIAISKFIEGLGQLPKGSAQQLLAVEQLGLQELRLRDALLRVAAGYRVLNDAIRINEMAYEKNGALIRQSEVMFGTVQNQLQLLKNEFNAVVVVAGGPYLAVWKNMIAGMRDWVRANEAGVSNAVTGTIESIGNSATAAAPVMSALASAIMSVTSALRDVPEMAKWGFLLGMTLPRTRGMTFKLGALGVLAEVAAWAATTNWGEQRPQEGEVPQSFVGYAKYQLGYGPKATSPTASSLTPEKRLQEWLETAAYDTTLKADLASNKYPKGLPRSMLYGPGATIGDQGNLEDFVMWLPDITEQMDEAAIKGLKDTPILKYWMENFADQARGELIPVTQEIMTAMETSGKVGDEAMAVMTGAFSDYSQKNRQTVTQILSATDLYSRAMKELGPKLIKEGPARQDSLYRLYKKLYGEPDAVASLTTQEGRDRWAKEPGAFGLISRPGMEMWYEGQRITEETGRAFMESTWKKEYPEEARIVEQMIGKFAPKSVQSARETARAWSVVGETIDGVTITAEMAQGFVDRLDSGLAKLADSVENWADSFSDNIADALVTGEANWKGFLESILKDIVRWSVRQTLVEPLVKPVQDAMLGFGRGMLGLKPGPPPGVEKASVIGASSYLAQALEEQAAAEGGTGAVVNTVVGAELSTAAQTQVALSNALHEGPPIAVAVTNFPPGVGEPPKPGLQPAAESGPWTPLKNPPAGGDLASYAPDSPIASFVEHWKDAPLRDTLRTASVDSGLFLSGKVKSIGQDTANFWGGALDDLRQDTANFWGGARNDLRQLSVDTGLALSDRIKSASDWLTVAEYRQDKIPPRSLFPEGLSPYDTRFSVAPGWARHVEPSPMDVPFGTASFRAPTAEEAGKPGAPPWLRAPTAEESRRYFPKLSLPQPYSPTGTFKGPNAASLRALRESEKPWWLPDSDSIQGSDTAQSLWDWVGPSRAGATELPGGMTAKAPVKIEAQRVELSYGTSPPPKWTADYESEPRWTPGTPFPGNRAQAPPVAAVAAPSRPAWYSENRRPMMEVQPFPVGLPSGGTAGFGEAGQTTGEAVQDMSFSWAAEVAKMGGFFSNMLISVGNSFNAMMGSMLGVLLGGSGGVDLSVAGFFKQWGTSSGTGLLGAIAGAGVNSATGSLAGMLNPEVPYTETMAPEAQLALYDSRIGPKSNRHKHQGGMLAGEMPFILRRGELVIPEERVADVLRGNRRENKRSATGGVTVNVPVQIGVSSFDPRTAASVIDANMPMIEKRIVAAIGRGGRVARAVGRRS